MATRRWAQFVRAAVVVTAGALLAAPAFAVPTSLSYVGQLRADSVPSTVDVTVTLFADEAGGSAVWGPQMWMDQPVPGGVLRLEIGGDGMPSLDPALIANDALWAEFTIEGSALAPRQRVGAAPFAIISETTRMLGGVDGAEYVTATEYANTPPTASSQATAPADPGPGQLWYNPAANQLNVWDSGEMAWVPVSAGGAVEGGLDPASLDDLTNGSLTNEFGNVSYQWSEGANIADASLVGPGAPAVATVDATEATESYITNIQISTNFSLTSGNNVEMKLVPPAGTGVGEIVLRDGSLPFGSYGDIWNPTNTPALGALLATNPSGTWTLAVIDQDNNLADSGPNSAGTLNAFELSYTVVRSDHVFADGLVQVDSLQVNNGIDPGTFAQFDGNVNIEGDLRVEGTLRRAVNRTPFTSQVQPDGSGLIASRTVNFTKTRDDTTVRIHWNDNVYMNTTSGVYFEFRINGELCELPGGNMRFWNQTTNSSQGYKYRHLNHIGFCSRLAGQSENIPAGEHTLEVWSSSSSPIIGYQSSPGFIIIEEIY